MWHTNVIVKHSEVRSQRTEKQNQGYDELEMFIKQNVE